MIALSLYKQMLLIRVLESELQKLCDSGEGADLHFSRGEEAISVGVCAALGPDDYICTHHRTIAHAVAKGVPLVDLVAEVLGKPGGINHGRAGEMHLNYPPAKFMFSWQLVGTCLPVSAGLAWASKYVLKQNSIVAMFFGDAATSNGQFHEGLSLAAIQQVPLLLICENNHLAGNVRPEHYLPPGLSVGARVQGYGLHWEECDGNKIDEVIEATREAAERVRRTSQPFFLDFDTTRLSKHKQGQGDARSKDELALLALRDPLVYAEKQLGLDGTAAKIALLSIAQYQVAQAIAKARQM